MVFKRMNMTDIEINKVFIGSCTNANRRPKNAATQTMVQQIPR